MSNWAIYDVTLEQMNYAIIRIRARSVNEAEEKAYKEARGESRIALEPYEWEEDGSIETRDIQKVPE